MIQIVSIGKIHEQDIICMQSYVHVYDEKIETAFWRIRMLCSVGIGAINVSKI